MSAVVIIAPRCFAELFRYRSAEVRIRELYFWYYRVAKDYRQCRPSNGCLDAVSVPRSQRENTLSPALFICGCVRCTECAATGDDSKCQPAPLQMPVPDYPSLKW